MSIHINAPPSTTEVAVIDCPTCERPLRMLVESAEWYGSTLTCAGCGDQWSDGERLERPFAPRWRERNIAYARMLLGTIGVRV